MTDAPTIRVLYPVHQFDPPGWSVRQLQVWVPSRVLETDPQPNGAACYDCNPDQEDDQWLIRL